MATTTSTTRTSQPRLTLAEWNARAIELARERGYQAWGPARSLSWRTDPDGALLELQITIPSATFPNRARVVRYDALADRAVCACPAAKYDKPCYHAGLGLAAGRYIKRLADLGWPED